MAAMVASFLMPSPDIIVILLLMAEPAAFFTRDILFNFSHRILMVNQIANKVTRE
ncbi:hypothetical protein [Agrobacterium vitis]